MTNKIFDFNSTDYNNFLKSYRQNQDDKKILVLAGNFETNRKYAIEQLITETTGEVVTVDLSDYISRFEEETYQKLDSLFKELEPVNGLVVFKGAENLCGVYTGFTYSVEKYATPQEKYFLKKLDDLNCTCIIEFLNLDHLDQTIIRKADAVIRFKVPGSLIEKIFFWLSQVRVNGSSLPSQRPA